MRMTTETVTQRKTTSEIITTLRHHFPNLSRQYDIKALGIFGSYVRNQQTAESDLDVLVEYTTIPGFFKLIQLQEEISTLLGGLSIDIVLQEELTGTIGQRIAQEVVWL
jgi:predicted nucleotidyltransferase